MAEHKYAYVDLIDGPCHRYPNTFEISAAVIDNDDLTFEVECVVDPTTGDVDQVRVLKLIWETRGWQWLVPSRLQDAPLYGELMSWINADGNVREIIDEVLREERDCA